jgi:hypothetical protein
MIGEGKFRGVNREQSFCLQGNGCRQYFVRHIVDVVLVTAKAARYPISPAALRTSTVKPLPNMLTRHKAPKYPKAIYPEKVLGMRAV